VNPPPTTTTSAGFSPTRAGERENLLWRLDAFQASFAEASQRPAAQCAERRRNGNRRVRLGGEGLQAAHQVHIRADHGKIEPVAEPDIAIKRLAEVQRHAAAHPLAQSVEVGDCLLGRGERRLASRLSAMFSVTG
jgi:hypothetical protein